MRRAVSLGAAIMIVGASAVSILAGPAAAAVSSEEIVNSLDVPVSTVTAAEVIGDPRAAATLSGPINGFPVKGSDYLVVSTGVATALPGDRAVEASTDLENSASADQNDLTQVKLTLVPPASATCVALDFAFLSEEYPEYVGPEFNFNDIFTAELNTSQFILQTDQVDAPNNFAYDSQGNPVSIDTVFGMSEIPGTVMDGSTPPLTAKRPVERNPDGSMYLFLSVQDLGDSYLDSAAVIDNLRWLSEPNCTEGATPIEPTPVPPTPVDPTRIGPVPVPPTPVGPSPVLLTPADRSPVPPTPIDRSPVSPTLIDRSPVSPAPAAPPSVDPPPVGAAPVPPIQVPLDPGSAGGPVNRAYLTTQVPSAADVFRDPGQLLLSALLAVLLVPVAVLLVPVVAFPAEFFESTFEENRATIERWFRWVPRPRRPDLSYWSQLGIFGLIAAALLMIVVPEVHQDRATLAQAVGFLLAVPLVVVVLEVPGNFYLRWKHRNSTRLEQLWQRAQHRQRAQQWSVLPSALIVAGLLAVLSRLAHFSPPYVYGLIAVYLAADQALLSLNKEEEERERGRRTLVGMLCLFAASVIAWFAWIPLGHTLGQGADGLGWLVADAFLPTFFLLGLETAVFAMIPMTFLKGKEVWRWRPALWVAVFLPIAFVFVNVQLAVREAADLTLPGTIRVVVLFCAFGLFSLAFWLYFHPGARRWFSHLVSR